MSRLQDFDRELHAHHAHEALNAAADEVRRIRENGLDEGMESHPTAEHFEAWLRARAERYIRDAVGGDS